MAEPDRFVLTGCASGIGRRTAELLVERGHRVLATDIAIDALRTHAARVGWPEERVRLAKLDVTDPDGWEAALDEATHAFGGVDVLMNIAGYLRPAFVADITPEDLHRTFDVNTKGMILGTCAAVRRMGRGGHVVNVASLAAMAPVPGLSVYSASKYAIRSFSLAAAMELRSKGIAVSVVCPDAVDTPMLDLQVDYEREAALTFSGPRVLTVDEVAGALCGEVLRRRPMELAIPRSRQALARLADVVPRIGQLARPLLAFIGRRNVRARR